MEELGRVKNEVKELRLALGLTQKSFADTIGVSVSAVKQWESGRCYPSPPHMKIITGIKEMLSAGVAFELSHSPGATYTDELIKKVYDKYIKDKLQ
jgi:transcriptional regulator with XRE-family HTH domain